MLFWAVLSISMITILGSTAVSPALAGIKYAFPGYSDEVIQLVLTIPPLFIIPSCFLCNYVVEKFGKKNVLIFGIILYLIGGIGAGLMPNFSTMLAARAVLGIACGFITPLAQALISTHFSGELRSKMTGYSASASYLMGIIASFTVAKMAAINWRLAFMIYAVALLVLVLNIRYLPKDYKKGMHILKKSDRRQKEEKTGVNKRAVAIVFGMGLINVAFYTFTASISLFMLSEGIGDKSASGTVVAIFMLSGFVLGLFVDKLRKYAGRFTMAFAAVLMGSGYLILSAAGGIIGLCAGAALIGGSYSIFYAGVFLAIGACSRNKTENTRLVIYTTAAMFSGQFLSAYILRAAEFLLRDSGYRFRFSFLSAGLFTAAFLMVLNKTYLKLKMHLKVVFDVIHRWKW